MNDHTLPLFSLQSKIKEIPLTQGQVAIVDAADFELLSQWKWFAYKSNKTFYAARQERLPNGKQRMVIMHRFIVDAPPDMQVDHKDGDGLNNTRDNLRPATRQQNMSNRPLFANNTSGFKGVRRYKGSNKCHAQIRVNGKSKHLGIFDLVEEAVCAYDAAARELHGEFARPNSSLRGE